MSTQTHTPLPWSFWSNTVGAWVIEGANNSVICQRNDWGHRAAESAANGRLFFAAADMLAALEPFAALIDAYKAALEADGVAHWVDFLQQVAWPSEAECIAAKAAIAKATGAAS